MTERPSQTQRGFVSGSESAADSGTYVSASYVSQDEFRDECDRTARLASVVQTLNEGLDLERQYATSLGFTQSQMAIENMEAFRVIREKARALQFRLRLVTALCWLVLIVALVTR